MRTVKIFGPPGTGKTTRCLQILEEELAGGTALNRIMYCTFSKAGATEAKQRAVDILSSANPDDFRYFKTIHAICFSELSLGKNHVVQPKDLLAFGRSVAIPFSEDYTDDLNIDGLPFGWASSKGSSILNIRQVAAARMVDHHKVEIPHSLTWPMVDDVLASYAKFKQDRALFDYVDFLQMYLKSGEPLPVDVVIVDEAQDLSRLQWEVVHRMAAGAKRMYLAGDDDQSIYGFMGADPYGFLEHPCDEVVVLNQSHHLPAKVLERANKVISRVRRRHPKEVAPVNDGGRMLFWNKSVTDILLTMAKAGRLENVMVIAAMNAILKRLKRDLDHHGIPSSLKGRPITQTDEAQVFYWYYKALQGTRSRRGPPPRCSRQPGS